MKVKYKILTFVFAVIFFVSCASENVTNSESTPQTADPDSLITAKNHTAGNIMDYFAEVTFGSEYGSSDSKLCKWKNTVKYTVSGDFTDSDTELIGYLVDTLNKINGFPGMKKASFIEKPNFTIDFISRDEIAESFEDAEAGTVGMAEYLWDSETHEITSSRVAIDKNEEYERASTICEEILQALGIGCDSYTYPDSVFYEGRSYYQRPSEIDWAVMSLLYSPVISAGMTKDEALKSAVSVLDWNCNN